ncbi:hypothetical protein SKAU_G00046370 [Synaphobranchus kaupii]|uniref:Uncharacterized protein n=1 Tax=Synaphobranchus kaupii TaxID=118154 RepID=A0A9Q1J9B8_SYNKA|nr:hypothetical protein SKAU_G00046370 [Synaphobranchus kaupii]
MHGLANDLHSEFIVFAFDYRSRSSTFSQAETELEESIGNATLPPYSHPTQRRTPRDCQRTSLQSGNKALEVSGMALQFRSGVEKLAEKMQLLGMISTAVNGLTSSSRKSRSQPHSSSGESHSQPRSSSGESHSQPRSSSGESHSQPRSSSGESHSQPRSSSGESHSQPRSSSGESHSQPRSSSGESHSQPRSSSGESHSRSPARPAERATRSPARPAERATP